MKFAFTAILCICVMLAPSGVEAQDHRVKITPEDKALINTLEMDKSFTEIECVALSMLKPRNEKDEVVRKKNNAVKESLFRAASSGTGIVKLKKRCHTDEGAPVVDYLIAEEGKITFVRDYSRDPFGTPSVHSFKVEKVKPGYFVDPDVKPTALRFVPTEEAVPKEVYLILRCLPQGELYF